MVVKFKELFHIEITVPDAQEAFRILHDIFGAEIVQEEFSGFLDGDYNKVVHVGLGDVVLQFIEPKEEGSSWDNQLKTKGSGVHNLNFTIDNAKEVVKELERLGGITPLFTFDLSWDKLIPPDFLKPNVKTVYMMDSMDKLGFHLEFGESPIKEDAPISLPETKYVTGRNELIGDISPMLHIELVTPDADKTVELVKKVFGSEKVELEFANFLDGKFNKVVHVNLSNVVLQYIEPLVKMGSWYELLQKNGTYVHNLTFAVKNMKEIVAKFKKEGIKPIFSFKLEWNQILDDIKPGPRPVYMMDTLDKLGFYLELGELPPEDEIDTFSKLFFVEFDKEEIFKN